MRQGQAAARKYPGWHARLIGVRRQVMKTLKIASLRGLGLALVLGGVAVLGSGCVAVPVGGEGCGYGGGYGYEGGPSVALPVPVPPVVVAPVPVYKQRGYGHWGYNRHHWRHYY